MGICDERWQAEREEIQLEEIASNAGFKVKIEQPQGIYHTNPEEVVLKMSYAMLPSVDEDCYFWEDYEKLTTEQKQEFLKVLMILSRTNLYKAWIDAQFPAEMDFPVDKLSMDKKISGKETKDALSAQQETQGIIICKNEKVMYLPYFFLSTGETRSGKKCNSDKINKKYVTLLKLEKQSFQEKLRTDFEITDMAIDFKRDNAMYVEKVSFQEKEIAAEQFQKSFHLVSPGFFLELQKENVLLTTKGIGHGYGMSVSYALTLAGQGKKHDEILKYFFDDIELERKYGV